MSISSSQGTASWFLFDSVESDNSQGDPALNRIRPLVVSAAGLGLSTLLLTFSSCGGGATTGPAASYTITASVLKPASVTAGSTSTSAIAVTPANGYAGSVDLSCKNTIGGMPAPTCSFSVSPVVITGTSPGTSMMTVTTSKSTAGGSHTILVTGKDAANVAPSNGSQTLTLTTAAVIQHVMVLFQENRSTDNLFHDSVLISRGADIASSGLNSHGQTIPLSPINLGNTGSNPQNYDLGHSHLDFVKMYDGGKMDGADLVSCGVTCQTHVNPQFMYVNPSDVQPYFAMAEQYTFGDRMFQTNEGPSFPAHQFLISGTSAPVTGSNLFAAENPSGYPAGCLAAPTERILLIDPTGSESNYPPIYPCFEHPTLTDLLDAKDVSWRYYVNSVGFIWTAPDAIEHICQPQTINGQLTCTGPDWIKDVTIPSRQVLQDIANGQLPQVSWIMPDGDSSDHPGISTGTGPSWVASIVNAIGNSQYWENTAIIITWDDWGGWYDHVAPKVINDGVSWGSGYVYGFRVPLIVVSPYAKAAYISHTTHDFGSILKFIETTFDLPSLGYADASADDLSDCFTFTQTPITFKTIPAPLDAAHFLNDKSPPIDPDDD